MTDPTMIDRSGLANLLDGAGPWTSAYVDGRGALPQVEEEAAREAVTNRLEEAGAPEADVTAITEALSVTSGTPSPSSRYVLARNGRVEVDETFPGARLGTERIAVGPVPEILPLLRHLARSVQYLVIETGREGAEVRLERADQHSPEEVENVDGRDDSLTKVQAGGWSHARYQRAAEEVWRHNQSDVADVVDRLTREHRPDFIIMAGDVRARQMLKEQLGEAAMDLLVEFDTHTRPEGADSEPLEQAIAEAADRHVRDEIDDAVERASVTDGSAGARGVSEVVTALQQARVATLVLDARFADDERTLHVLDAAPWVAEREADRLDATVLGQASAAEALARAAILTGAQVLIREEAFDAPDEPRTESEVPDPLAALRWADGADTSPTV